MATLDALMIRLARRHRWQQLIVVGAPRLVASTILAAVVIAVVRLALPNGDWLVPAIIAAGVLTPLPWLPGAWRQRTTTAALAGELDLLAGADGLVMGYAEQRDPAWAERCSAAVQRITLPPLRDRPLMPAFFGVLLMLGAWCLPQAMPLPALAGPAEALVKPLRDELARLAEAAIITPLERKELDQRLAELVARSQGGTLDQATWEGLDRLQTQLAAQSTAAGAKLAAALAAAQAAAAPESPDQSTATSPEAAALLASALAANLASDLAKLAEQAPGLVPDLADPHQQQALAQALDKALRQGLISKAQAEALQRAGVKPGRAGDPSPNPAQARALARRLADELNKRKNGLSGEARTAAEAFLARLSAEQNCDRGGPSRGPGEAPLDRIARARTAGGDQAALAPGATLNPDGSVTVAAQARDAQADDAALHQLERAAARAFDPTAADSRRATVAPRHRGAVEAYFADK